MQSTREARLARAETALTGLWVGDSIGMFFEGQPFGTASRSVSRGVYPPGPWEYTDDTEMALSIYTLLRFRGEIDQDLLSKYFANRYEDHRNYGMGARRLLDQIRSGIPWREASQQLFKGGSYGNGGAMRIAPLGAYFADDLKLCVEQAQRSCEVTHAHAEGIAGGIAVAVAAALACRCREEGQRPTRAEFVDAVLDYVPPGEIFIGLERARDLPLGFDDLKEAVQALTMMKRGWETAQDCVPLVLWAVGESLDNYRQGIEQLLLAGGDTDTNAAMGGGIIACYVGEAGIPAEWRDQREELPWWAL